VIDLDDPTVVAGDSLGLFAQAASAVRMLEESVAGAREVPIPYPPEAITDVVVCGMGGSASAADLLVGAYWEHLRRPVHIVRDYTLPGWAGESTLVIACSYSGTTEETLTCMMDAVDRTCPAIAVTTGGKLDAHYRPQDVPVFTPPPAPMPRAATVQMLGILLVIMTRMHVLDVVGSLDAELEDGTRVLQTAIATYGPDAPEADNAAKQLARLLDGMLPMILGGGSTAAMAYRWKCQINENAELPAVWSTLPEHNHNELVGVEGLTALGIPTAAVFLQDPRQHPQIIRRFAVMRDLMSPSVRTVIGVSAEGATTLGRLADLLMMGDYVSLYMAARRGVDPGPIDMIDRLKEGLAAHQSGRTAQRFT